MSNSATAARPIALLLTVGAAGVVAAEVQTLRHIVVRQMQALELPYTQVLSTAIFLHLPSSPFVSICACKMQALELPYTQVARQIGGASVDNGCWLDACKMSCYLNERWQSMSARPNMSWRQILMVEERIRQ